LLCSGQQSPRDPGSVFQTDRGRRPVDLDIVNMDVAAVLKIISDAGGWTIIPSRKVTENAKVSLWCKGTGARQLLDKLCLVHNYVYKEEEGNLIYLMTKDEYEQVFGGVSRMFVLKFQRAETIKPLIESSVTKGGKVGIDSWSNTIIVNDTAENLQKLESLVARLDQGFEQKRYQLSHARAAEVAQIIEQIYPKEGSIQVDARTNAIILFRSQAGIKRAEELIACLDQDRITKVFSIRFQSATDLARQLSGLQGASSGSGRGGAARLTGGTADASAGMSSLRNSQFDSIVVSETTNQIIATGSAAEIEYIDGLIRELDSQVITTTIRLKRLKASTVMSQVSHLASRPENITADSEGNSLIIRDNSNNVDQIRKVVLELDEALVTKVITLQYALASDIQNVLQAMVTNPEAFRADTRTNQIVISDSASQVARIEEIIASLDAEDAYFTRTFRLQHAPASAVADVIETFLSGQRSEQAASAADRGYGVQGGEAATSQPSTDSATPMRENLSKGVSKGSAPGLAGVRARMEKKTAESAIPTTDATSPSQTNANGSPVEGTSHGLGAAGTVVADDRSNTVTITETLAVLTKIEQLIQELDKPVEAYQYTIQCRQVDSEILDAMIPGLLRAAGDSYFLDEQSRSVHFTTIPSVAERLIAVLREWDRPARQVLIRAKILTANISTLRDLGITFETTFDVDGAGVTLGSTLPSQVTEGLSGSLNVQKLTGTQFEVLIRAIETDSRSHILANPRILAMDNNAATVSIATDEPFTQTSIDSESGATIADVEFLQVGTTLEVTPHINEDSSIEMEVSLDVSSLTEIRNGIPVVSRNIAKSNVAVKNNHILMIGGLRHNSNLRVKSKVPLLGDIPLLGLLFRSDRKQLAEEELVLFLQPSIVERDEGEERIPDPNEFKECP
jgi:type II secretory pathway component GspD/PulD (secretin)